jgi:uncharacterized cupredoxin-like copper-binding protein
MFTLSKGSVAVIYLSALFVLVAGCGDSGADTTTSATSTQGESGFGSPADPGDADRTVEIDASDEFFFDPADLTVTVGETITFRVVNDGSLTHDFTLGDQATQDEHEAEMAEMGEMAHDQPNVVTIPAGETMEITWTFTEAGTVLIGCHQPGHYAAGMKGLVTVES